MNCRNVKGSSLVDPQIYKGDPEFAPFWSGMGLKLGVFGFSRNQNNRGLSGVYVICICCGLIVKINTHKICTACKDRTFAFAYARRSYVCFCICGQQKPKDPQFEPHGHGRWCHITGRYTRSGISLLYLRVNQILKIFSLSQIHEWIFYAYDMFY